LNEIDTDLILEKGIKYLEQEFGYAGKIESQEYVDGKYIYRYIDSLLGEDDYETSLLFEIVLEYNFNEEEFILISRNQVTQDREQYKNTQ
jgi:hypothetical protein